MEHRGGGGISPELNKALSSMLMENKKQYQYGQALEEYDTIMVEGYSEGIPSVLVMLWSMLVSNGGLEEEGIFRMSPSTSLYEKGLYDLQHGVFNTITEPHVIARLIKVSTYAKCSLCYVYFKI